MNKSYIISLILIFGCRAEEKIAIISIPKCGSFLAYKCVELLADKKPYHKPLFSKNFSTFDRWGRNFITNHEPPCNLSIKNCVTYDIKVVFIIRDPRDQIVSAAYFYDQNNKNIAAKISYIIENISILLRITLGTPRSNICSYYKKFLPWQNYPFVYTTTFEKLIGPRGGGTKEEQFQEIYNIRSYAKH